MDSGSGDGSLGAANGSGDRIWLRTHDAAVRRIQDLAARRRTTAGSVVDAFIEERRAEATKE